MQISDDILQIHGYRDEDGPLVLVLYPAKAETDLRSAICALLRIILYVYILYTI